MPTPEEMHENWIEGPDRIAPQLALVAGTEAFVIRELPGSLDDAGTVVLVRRLVPEGLSSVDPDEAA